VITEETALLYCTKRSVVSRGIDNIKKSRGELTTTANSLRMKVAPPGGIAPPILKIK
jgi:twitching motility protein PilT